MHTVKLNTTDRELTARYQPCFLFHLSDRTIDYGKPPLNFLLNYQKGFVSWLVIYVASVYVYFATSQFQLADSK